RIGEICFLPMQSGKTQHVWTYPNNLSSYGNKAVAVPHPPLRGTFPPGKVFPQALSLSNNNLSN
ncbi:MAG: hypothetical protein SPI15_04495, partial [Candidatus Faecousia sp.]|nr:hypothetical protein [Clostridiales bacterium]MDY6180093.1 hypothetical protein [Candidatus Faecousia sp.]